MVDGPARRARTGRCTASAPVVLLVLALLTGAAPGAGATADIEVDQRRLAEVEDYLETEREALGIPGMAASLVVGDETVLELGLGTADERGTPVTPTTPFLVASLAKSVTALAVLTLVDRGDVDLDRPVATYLPELAPGGESVTVADLLHHRAGPSTREGLEPFAGPYGSSLERNAERLAGRLRPAAFAYTNAGYDVLALLVERVSGTSFEQYLQREVLGPLGMTATTTDPAVARGAGLADGHHHWLALGYRPHTPPLPDGMVGSYRMFSSARDLGALVAAHLSGPAVLTPGSWAWLHTGSPERADPGYGGGLGVFPADRSGGDPLRSQVTLAHDGSALGYRSMMWMLPEEDVGFVVVANANDQTDEYQLVRVAYNVQRLLRDVPLAERAPEADPVTRFGMEAIALLVVAQVVLAPATLRPLRRRLDGERATRSDRLLVLLAATVDVVALLSVLLVAPAASETPLPVLVQAPDLRVLMVAVVALGGLLGALRLAIWVRPGSDR